MGFFFQRHCCSCAWLSSYDRVQCIAVALIYIQILCAVIGSLGATYAGVAVANLAVALFALVAVESGSQNLGRTYAGLLACALLLDVAWLVLFTRDIWHIAKDPDAGSYVKFSVMAVLSMEIAGFVVRFFSAFLWVQMYRLGASRDLTGLYQHIDFGGIGTVGFTTPLASPAPSRQVSGKEDIVGGSIYNPAYYSSLFQPAGTLAEANVEIVEEKTNGDMATALASCPSERL
ncbi:uncharacterized protein LOC9638879 [Selaginella moellendorffii]|uniref:uncharacterized protein LOC9638879 n=1 Tax=Selaginella moellendorffii TaxID=88036 RepID=UPI000D1C6265|nr:uncharacterized protein LOC9638879 [Selaginella moellendorffii]|eukprot:XP_002988533.2 uncharacterized protein LOC9638879 [Selaginella moellendorffii]